MFTNWSRYHFWKVAWVDSQNWPQYPSNDRAVCITSQFILRISRLKKDSWRMCPIKTLLLNETNQQKSGKPILKMKWAEVYLEIRLLWCRICLCFHSSYSETSHAKRRHTLCRRTTVRKFSKFPVKIIFDRKFREINVFSNN